MKNRILLHVLFWTVFVLLYAGMQMAFAGPSDMAYAPYIRFFRFVFSEIAVLPWKIIPFYVLFYLLIPRYFGRGQYIVLLGWFILVLFCCVLGYRSMVRPVSMILYNEVPEFNVYSLRRLLFTLTEILPASALASTAKLLRGRILAQKKLFSLQAEKKEIELGYLKAQMNPHFLFNTLNNLYGLARKDAKDTAPYILQLSSLMRYLLHEGKREYVTIEKEIKLLKDYIQLEQLRYSERLEVVWEEKVDHYQRKIPPLLLLPFVENAFKHGISETRFDTFIKIRIILEEDQLFFEVINPFEEEQKEIVSGVGLKNIQRQLQLLFNKQFELKVDVVEQVFTIQLKVQLDKYETRSLEVSNYRG